MNGREAESCIKTIGLLKQLAYNVHGVMDFVDDMNCSKIVETLQGQHWIKCSDRLPEKGKNVILFFRDTVHSHSSWEEYTVQPAWICNWGEPETPDGAWAISGRYGGFGWVEPLNAGIAWFPLPEPPAIAVLDDFELEGGRLDEP